jgi:endonuclease/exonuclease/phosphatase (EEP) superfamily protein YafD
MKGRAQVVQLCIAVALLTAALVMVFAPDAYLPMLLRAFMLPACVAFGLIAVVAMCRRAWWVSLSALCGGAMMAVQLITPTVAMGATDGSGGLRVFHANVWQPNTAHQAAIDRALASDADVISVQEVAPAWAAALAQGLAETYPYTHIETRADCYGIALFSRIPFHAVRTITLHGTPMIEALFHVDGRPVRLLAVHATSPISYAHFQRRNLQLHDLGLHLAQDDTATIVVGDLNTVPWDRAYQRLCNRAGLRSTTPATQRTWPSIGPLALIPLDHLLISPGITPSALRTVHIPGSDHKGLLAELTLPSHAH